jgi:hypothetical protein
MLVVAAVLLSCTFSVAQEDEPASELELASLSGSRLEDLSYGFNIKGEHTRARDAAFEMFARDSQSSIASLLMAYSLRGEGNHHGAIAYNTLVLYKRKSSERWHRMDALTGRAASYIALGRLDAAEADLIESERLAKDFMSDQPDEPLPYYQLGCVCSVRSSLWAKRNADEQAASEKATSVAYLLIAKKNGYDRWDHAGADLDLKPLHGYAMFDKLVK